MLAGPVLDLGEIAARVRRCEAREDPGGFGHVDVEGYRRDVRMTHEGLAQGVDAVIWTAASVAEVEDEYRKSGRTPVAEHVCVSVDNSIHRYVSQ